uniref:Metal ABC transporter ATP-binding protein n=1 Tax=Thermodesulfobacterium geofontis TaxID=1295609 RepID=A0A7V6CDP2_9BACT
MSQIVIEVQNLYFYYEQHLVLEDINLKVEKGDFLALIGPNGGGKTTLAKCILGFLIPSKGRVFLWGKEIKNFKSWHKIGYVPQRAGDLIDSLTPLSVKEFLLLPFKWYDISLKPSLLDKLIEKFGMKNLLNKKIGELSYGQLQRSYIVRALISDPEILILDEPSVGLDFFTQEVFYETLEEFHKKGLTIILITHETWLLTKWVNKVACINQKLYFHGDHESFCVMAKKLEFFREYHKIEHTHW